MQSWFNFELDGETCRVERESTRTTLAQFLARLAPCFSHFLAHDAFVSPRLVVMGTKENDCYRFRVVDAGLLLMPMVADRQIWTPEGIRTSEPEHPVNLAFLGGGYECSRQRLDNIIALTFEGYYRSDLRRQGQMYDQFDAITTRTANPEAIRETALQVFASTEQLRFETARRAERSGEERSVWTGKKDIFGDRFTRHLFRQPDRRSLQYVDGEKHRFFRPDTLVDLLRLRRDYPGAGLIAGATGQPHQTGDAMPMEWISLDAINELNLIETKEEEWIIGAAVNLTQISEQIGRECRVFTKILRRFASRPVRNRATLGGSLASAYPSGQIAPLLIALNAQIQLASTDGEREMPVAQFYSEGGVTTLRSGEVIRAVVIPRATESALSARGITTRICDVYSVGPRRANCSPYLTAGFALELRNRKITKAWLTYGGIEKALLRVQEAEDFLLGRIWDEETMIETLPVLHRSIEISPDESGEAIAAYRKQLTGTLFQKFYYQHPSHNDIHPQDLTAISELGRLDDPFHDSSHF